LTREELKTLLDELAFLGVIRYEIIPREKRQPLLNVFKGPAFDKPPLGCSSSAIRLFDMLLSGEWQAIVNYLDNQDETI
jgi:hypothetical protein